MSNKQYLDAEGVARLVQNINQQLTRKVNYPDLNNYATTASVAELESKITNVYHFRGSVATAADLDNIIHPEVGDVYNIIASGMNVGWTGEGWDDFGSIADLTAYLKDEDVIPISRTELDTILYSGDFSVVTDAAGIKAMINNDQPEVTIILNKDIAHASVLTIPEGKSVILDLNNKSITGDSYLAYVDGGDLTIKNGELESTGRPVVVTSGSLTIDEGAEITSTSDVAVNATGADTHVVMNGGKINAQESGILITTGASLVMNDGEIECTDNCPIQGNGSSGQGNINVVMNGGKLTAHITSAGYAACGVYMPNSGTFTMNGGEIESDGAGIVMRAGQVNLNGGSVSANGTTGQKGKVGDSKITVGPYAVVYDESAKYPASGTLELNIANGVHLYGTDGDIDVLLSAGATTNINDYRA